MTWLDRLDRLDRRWIFLAMLVAVAWPLLAQVVFPEQPTPLTLRVFEAIESLPAGSRVLLSLDYDPASAAELAPMATAFTRHCCLKRHKVYLNTMWPTGVPMVDEQMRDVMEREFAEAKLRYGVDYVHLGYQPGEAVAIKTFCENFRKVRQNDHLGGDLDSLPMMEGVSNAGDFDLVCLVSAGYPGAKEWIQYGRARHRLKIVAGCTGVQAPQLFPYYPEQLAGLLAAIKGAAEYEACLTQHYPEQLPAERNTAMRRMGPQLFAHLLIIGLIVMGNVIHVTKRYRVSS